MNRPNFHVKKGDSVQVISGNHKGATGKILAGAPEEEQVLIEGVRMIKKHTAKIAGTSDRAPSSSAKARSTFPTSSSSRRRRSDSKTTKKRSQEESQLALWQSNSTKITKTRRPGAQGKARLQEHPSGSAGREGGRQHLHQCGRTDCKQALEDAKTEIDTDHRARSPRRPARRRASRTSSCARIRRSAPRSPCAARGCTSSSSA